MLTSDPDQLQFYQQLFKREAETLQKLARNNPHIPLLIAYFEEKGEFYLVQEYIEGKTLTNEVKSGQKLAESEVIKIITELLEIVAYLHDNTVIHRDIKPDNIMRRNKDHKLILIDFGAVKQISSQRPNMATIIGTRGYMPKEQADGNPQYNSDIYAIAIIAIQALTGLSPLAIPQDSEGELIWQNQANVSNNLANILAKMVRFNYRERFTTAQDVLDAIKEMQNTLSPTQVVLHPSGNSSSTQVVVTPTLTSSPPRNKSILIGISLSILLALSSLFFIKNNDSGYQLQTNGKTINGDLKESDALNPLNNSYQDEYLLKGKQGETIVINLDSADFDPVLSVYLGTERIKINNDILPDNFNAEISIALPKTATYKVIVSSNKLGETGSYHLQAKVK